jgi:hypothetical protein
VERQRCCESHSTWPLVVCRDDAPWVCLANVRSELFVAALLKVLHHRIHTVSDGRTRRVEDPCTLGTAPTAKARLVHPHQHTTHHGPTLYEKRN